MAIILILLAAVLTAPCAKADWVPLVMEAPAYPVLGEQAQLAGSVELQVVLDRYGKVLTAKAVSGHPILAHAAEENLKVWVFRACGDAEREKAGGTVVFTYIFKLESITHPRTRFRYEHPYRVTVVGEPQHWMPGRSSTDRPSPVGP